MQGAWTGLELRPSPQPRGPGWAKLTPLRDVFTPEVRAQRVLLLLVATALMGLADLAMTLTYVTSVGMVERNPIARLVMDLGHPHFLIAWKLSTMLFGLGVLWYARRTRPAEVAAWLCFLAMTALSVHWLGFTGAVASMTQDYGGFAMAQDPGWVSME